jgi:hypothetical protein
MAVEQQKREQYQNYLAAGRKAMNELLYDVAIAQFIAAQVLYPDDVEAASLLAIARSQQVEQIQLADNRRPVSERPVEPIYSVNEPPQIEVVEIEPQAEAKAPEQDVEEPSTNAAIPDSPGTVGPRIVDSEHNPRTTSPTFDYLPPELPEPQDTPGDVALLSGTWQSRTGSKVRIVDDGETIGITLIESGHLSKLNAQLRREGEKLRVQFWLVSFRDDRQQRSVDLSGTTVQQVNSSTLRVRGYTVLTTSRGGIRKHADTIIWTRVSD